MQFTTPKTVAQAIEPFEKVKTNLKVVLSAQVKKRIAAQGRLDAARKVAVDAETTETANIKATHNEELQAKALIKKLDALLSPSPAGLDTMDLSEKAKAEQSLD